MQQSSIPISTLVGMFRRGDLQLPSIQRKFVWEATKVRDLLDSLYRGYPSGSILMWNTDDEVATKESSIQQQLTPLSSRLLLLDGQQRLTSLAAVLNGEKVTVRNKKRPIEILFNLEHPEGPPSEVLELLSDAETGDPDDELVDPDETDDEDEGENEDVLKKRLNRRTFVGFAKSLASQSNWVSVSDVFKKDDTTILMGTGITDLSDPRYMKYAARLTQLRKILDYMYVVHVLDRDMSYEEVTEIFVRVNSAGAKLRSSDLALAQMTSRWPNLLEELEAFQAECDENGFGLDLGTIVRAIVVHTTHQCLFRRVSTTPIDKLKLGWIEAQEGLRYAINFLRTRVGIEDESLLSSPFLIVSLSAVIQNLGGKLSETQQKKLLHWFLVANARGRYGRGSSESLLNEDLAIVYRGAGIEGLTTPMLSQFGRLEIELSDIAGKNKRSPLFALAYLVLKDLGATDWMTGLGLSLVHQGNKHVIQHHHIFPKSKLNRAGYNSNEINEIANFAFIGGGTNREITNKDPIVYLPKIIKTQTAAALETQLVPNDPQIWEMSNYREFLEYRRAALVKAMNQFIAAKAGLASE